MRESGETGWEDPGAASVRADGSQSSSPRRAPWQAAERRLSGPAIAKGSLPPHFLRSFFRAALCFIGMAVLVFACGKKGALDPDVRVRELGREIRCPVCRGVPIAESPAPLAQQMMTLLREQVAQGKGDEEILKFFEERYGEWALLEPKREGLNWIIWIIPILAFVGGGALIVMRVRRRG